MNSRLPRTSTVRRVLQQAPLMLLLLAGAGLLAGIAAPSAAAEDIRLPLKIDKTLTLEEQFGYAPSYTRNVPGFDAAGNAYIRSRSAGRDDTSYVATQNGAVWERRDLLEALRSAYPDFAGTVGAGGYFSARIIFDVQDRAYTVLTIRTEEGDLHNVLLYSLDDCQTWLAAELPFGDRPAWFDGKNVGNVACEHYTGHNPLDGPPFIAVWRRVGPWPGDWADRQALYVLQPYFEDGRLVIPEPVFVTDRFLGMLQCGGDSSFAATLGDKTFFAWAQVTTEGHGGSPTYVGVYDRTLGSVVQRRLVARVKSINDCHTTPGVCLDSQGYVHVVAGAHSHPFKYTHSLLPGDASLWTQAQPVLMSGWVERRSDADGWGRQTYVSLVCDKNDVLRLVYRQNRLGVDRWLDWGETYALCMQSRPPNASWSSPRMLAVGTVSEQYANYNQHLAISPSGRLFLSFSYYTHSSPRTPACLSALPAPHGLGIGRRTVVALCH